MDKYSKKRFHLALSDILRKKNIKLRGLASRTNLNYTYFSKLKSRKKSPPIKTIEIISGGLGIPPDYFLEYRVHKITGLLFHNPEYVEKVLSYIEDLEHEKVLKVAEPDEGFGAEG